MPVSYTECHFDRSINFDHPGEDGICVRSRWLIFCSFKPVAFRYISVLSKDCTLFHWKIMLPNRELSCSGFLTVFHSYRSQLMICWECSCSEYRFCSSAPSRCPICRFMGSERGLIINDVDRHGGPWRSVWPKHDSFRTTVSHSSVTSGFMRQIYGLYFLPKITQRNEVALK